MLVNKVNSDFKKPQTINAKSAVKCERNLDNWFKIIKNCAYTLENL